LLHPSFLLFGVWLRRRKKAQLAQFGTEAVRRDRYEWKSLVDGVARPRVVQYRHSMIPVDQRPSRGRNREKRVLSHLPLVRSIASRLRRRVPHVEMDDLVSAGTIGLIEAADRYDAAHGVRFASFAYGRVEGAIIDEIRRVTPPKPAPAQAESSAPLSLEAPIVEEQDLTLIDLTVNPLSPEPDTCAELGELLEAFESLPRREREMLGLHTRGHTVAEIAGLYGCSESRASQLLAQARFRLEERTAA
jgi:RNA polymerase sigma factor (sigma-70 family)